MNQRYIDFVPAKKDAKEDAKTAPAQATAVFVRKTVVRELKPATPVIKPVAKPVVKPVSPAPKPVEPALNPAAKTFVRNRETLFGVIEDYEPLFTGAPVEKRPLSTPRQSTELSAAKAKKVRSPLFGPNLKKAAKTPVEEKAPAAKAPEIETLKTPATPFIKSAQVEKRPLSKNVYKKPTPAPVKELSDPVTIIDKPKRDAHIGPIIAIVLTIILGAAAGTVAFLLLPKK